MKKLIIIAAVVLVVSAGIGFYINKSANPPYELATVQRGDITQEVFASGKIEAPTSIDLHFKTSGKIASLEAKVGKNVKAGALLAKQDTAVLDAQLAEAQASVSVQTAKLHSLQAGSLPEDIRASQAALDKGKQDLANYYATVDTTLAASYAKANDAVRTQLSAFFTNAEQPNPKLTFQVSDNQVLTDIQYQRSLVSIELNNWQNELSALNSGSQSSTLENALSNGMSHLAVIKIFFGTAQKALNAQIDLSANTAGVYLANVAAGLNEVNAAVASINALIQNIASQKITIEQLQAQLNLKQVAAKPQDIEAQEAAVQQAQASAAAIQAQIRDMEIVAPISGIVTATNGNVGEIIDPSITVVSMISGGALQVKVNLSEDNVAGVKVGQPVRITADALSTEWPGAVTAVDPAGTVINGSVYYKTTITFNESDSRVKAGMTSDVWIKTGSAASALIVPASAIQKNGSVSFVQIYKNGKITSQNVTTGLKSQNGTIEIVSGLSEGEQVVIGGKPR